MIQDWFKRTPPQEDVPTVTFTQKDIKDAVECLECQRMPYFKRLLESLPRYAMGSGIDAKNQFEADVSIGERKAWLMLLEVCRVEAENAETTLRLHKTRQQAAAAEELEEILID